MTLDATNTPRDEVAGEHVADGEAGAEKVRTESSTVRQPTGDVAVDDVLGQLDAAANHPLDSQILVGEQVLQVLQGRLADLGKE